jgi:hypothetical protein
MMGKTGLAGNAYGIAPNEDHKAGGGYHCGVKDCQNINKYHPPATSNVGARTEDYSVRQLRDRLVGGNAASAEDIGGYWPRGGKAAWLRFNNLFIKQLQAGDRALRAVREVNFTPDGTARKRWDALHPNDGVYNDGIVPSTDTAETHTHVGFWRDTDGTPARDEAFARIEQIADAAIANRPLADGEDDEDMGATLQGQVPEYSEFTDEVTGKKHAIGHTIAPGIIADGAANPRDGWFNLIGDGFGQRYAVRVMVTQGNADANGNVGWEALFKTADGKAKTDVVVLRSGERRGEQLPKGTTGISVMRYAVNADGKAVPVDTTQGLLPNPHGLAWSIELGPVKQ